ncbi:MAG: Dabb family protein [Zavarzinella sp.]|nr:Dabb family protein [Zavarzinella sp.]
MKHVFATLTVALVLSVTARADDPAVVHNVFFELKDKSADAKKKLVDACYKYLKSHDGVLHFGAGVRAEDVKEKVSAADWDVGLHIVFKDKASLAKYARHPDHLKFIAENKENWKGVKVYDSEIDPSRK